MARADGVIEVVAIGGVAHMGRLAVGLARAQRLCQCSTVVVQTLEQLPMQVRTCLSITCIPVCCLPAFLSTLPSCTRHLDVCSKLPVPLTCLRRMYCCTAHMSVLPVLPVLVHLPGGW